MPTSRALAATAAADRSPSAWSPAAPSGGDADERRSGGTQDRRRRHPRLVGDVEGACSQEFTEETGYTVKVEPNGDAGQLTNKLVLTKGSPIADMVYGIDNTFASRAVDEGVLADYTPKDVPASAATYALGDAGRGRQLTPVDYGDVCVNIDDVWFASTS